jgi:hypothetical protein
LLLTLCYDGVQRSRLKMTERMQVEVLRQLRCDAGVGKGVAHRVGVRRNAPAGLGREYEAGRNEFVVRVLRQSLLFGAQLLELLESAFLEGPCGCSLASSAP